METESIVYFHPMQDMYKMTAAKRHWWEGVSLPGRVCGRRQRADSL